ncbi:MAG: integron integrase, partial [Verrucomicrobiota bacterium]
TGIRRRALDIKMKSWERVEADCRRKMALRHLSIKTEKSYLSWIKRYYFWLIENKPTGEAANKMEAFLTYLAVDGKVSASTQNQAFNALLFLYRRVIEVELGEVNSLRAKTPIFIRDCPTPKQMAAILKEVRDANGYPIRLLCGLLYGCGLRVSEPLDLRVKDVRLNDRRLILRACKGGKDRMVRLPDRLCDLMAVQLRAARGKWEFDHHNQLPVTLPNAYGRKDPSAARSWEWYWVFPQHKPCKHPRTGEIVRFHLHEANIQREVRRAKKAAGISARITPHNFRHAYATHCLDSGSNIHDVCEAMGHKCIETTKLYLHPAPERVPSPLDELAI